MIYKTIPMAIQMSAARPKWVLVGFDWFPNAQIQRMIMFINGMENKKMYNTHSPVEMISRFAVNSSLFI